MKAFGLLSLLLALLIVAVLARKQLGALRAPGPGSASSGAVGESAAGLEGTRVDNAEDARRVQQRVQNDVDRMMQDRASQVERGAEGSSERP